MRSLRGSLGLLLGGQRTFKMEDDFGIHGPAVQLRVDLDPISKTVWQSQHELTSTAAYAAYRVLLVRLSFEHLRILSFE